MSTNTDQTPRPSNLEQIDRNLSHAIAISDARATGEWISLRSRYRDENSVREIADTPAVPTDSAISFVEQRLAALEAVVFAKEEQPQDKEHNPHNVPPDKIPAGYRLARKDEVDSEFHVGSKWGHPYYKEFHSVTSTEGDGAYHKSEYTIIVPITPKAEGEDIDWIHVAAVYDREVGLHGGPEHNVCPPWTRAALKAAYAEICRQKGQQP